MKELDKNLQQMKKQMEEDAEKLKNALDKLKEKDDYITFLQNENSVLAIELAMANDYMERLESERNALV